MLRREVPDGTAIATANARIKRMRRAGTLSNRAIEKHFGKFKGGGKFGKFIDKNGSKYGGKEMWPIDASSR
jgi:hypothetical protein